MAHPYAGHRQTAKEHSRVSHITKGYKSGGAVKGKVTHGAKANREMSRMEMEAEGDKSKHRMDRPKRAKGGRVKGGSKTVVNVITGHPGGGAPPAPPMGIAGSPPGAMPPPMAARPPMPPPQGMPPGGPPPGMPARKAGGRVKRADGGTVPPPNEWRPPDGASLADILKSSPRLVKILQAQPSSSNASPWPKRAKGGRVQTPTGTGVAGDSGVGSNRGDAVFNASRKSGTHLSHSDGKDDGKDIGRGRVVSFRTGGGVHKTFRAFGGRVESPDGVAKATKLPGGAGGGEARLAKERRAERKR